MAIRIGKDLTPWQEKVVVGEYKRPPGRPPLPKIGKQKNRQIAIDDVTFATANELAKPETLSKYIRRLIWEDAERRRDDRETQEIGA
jgi:hypothetical protein